MRLPSILLKLAAVASSLLLVGSFICHRAGGFNRLLAPNPSSEEPAAVEQPPRDTTEADLTIMSGSKDMVPLIVPASPAPIASTTQPPPIIMGGTKSEEIIRPADAQRLLTKPEF